MSQNPEQTIAELQQKIKSLELQLKKAKDSSGYGLKWEEKPEIFEERAQNALPLLREDKSLLIDNKSDLDHIIIEWDNYHALSALNYTHKWMIDLIYIDPPYNTGNKDFIYNDKYLNPDDEYKHSTWLSFMNKRLKLAKKLLSNDWAIFISIDDNEQANLKLLCDEIFWPNRFITSIPRLTKSQRAWQENYMDISHDYIIVYANCDDFENITDRNYDENNVKQDNIWKYIEWDTKAILAAQSQWYSKWWDYDFQFNWKIYQPVDKNWNRNRWLWTRERMEAAANLWILVETANTLRSQLYIDKKFDESTNTMVDKDEKMIFHTSDFMINSAFTNSAWDKLLQSILGKSVFNNPKPIELIKKIISFINNKNLVVLDFFAWSWTTWHAVLDLNRQDWWNRQFILCSNRENTDENPDKNICRNVTYERVKRVMQWYTNLKWEEVKWLWWWNLRYYTTEFIEKKKSADDLRQSFIYLCDELLCIKEDTFNEYKSELLSDKLKCYQKNNHYTVILYDIREIEKLQQLLSTLDGKISVYIFSLSKDSCEEELQEFSDKVTIENIPDDILETYKKIF